MFGKLSSKIKKILLCISLLPYFAILASGIYCAFNGAVFFFSTEYGFSAFIIGLLVMAYRLCVIPVLPVCILYQLYLLIEKHTARKRLAAGAFLAAGFLVCAGLLWANFGFYVQQGMEKNRAEKMIERADETVVYGRGTFYVSGIYDTDYSSDTIFLNYETMEIGFLMYEDYEEYFSVRLKPANEADLDRIYEDYFVQADIPLNDGRLLAFYPDEGNRHRTIALVLETGGRSYQAFPLYEPGTKTARFTGLHWSEYFPGENVKYKDLQQTLQISEIVR